MTTLRKQAFLENSFSDLVIQRWQHISVHLDNGEENKYHYSQTNHCFFMSILDHLLVKPSFRELQAIRNQQRKPTETLLFSIRKSILLVISQPTKPATYRRAPKGKYLRNQTTYTEFNQRASIETSLKDHDSLPAETSLSSKPT